MAKVIVDVGSNTINSYFWWPHGYQFMCKFKLISPSICPLKKVEVARADYMLYYRLYYLLFWYNSHRLLVSIPLFSRASASSDHPSGELILLARADRVERECYFCWQYYFDSILQIKGYGLSQLIASLRIMPIGQRKTATQQCRSLVHYLTSGFRKVCRLPPNLSL